MSAVEIQMGYSGSLVMIEPPQRAGLDQRAFKRLPDGSLVWCHLADWRENNERARFYGFASKELPESMVCK